MNKCNTLEGEVELCACEYLKLFQKEFPFKTSLQKLSSKDVRIDKIEHLFYINLLNLNYVQFSFNQRRILLINN